MKVLVIGGAGMLGHKLLQVLQRDFDVYATLRSGADDFLRYGILPAEKLFENLDVLDFESVEKTVSEKRPDFIINCVGVIKQLPEAKDLELTLGINSIFPQRMARIAPKYGFKFINVSTDCVFSGKKGNYIEEDCADAEDLYGKSKFLGEVLGANCLTLRTSIIGRELKSAHSLIEWFLSNRGGTVKGFTNAIYTGFPTIVLAEIISRLIKNHPELEGLYHVSSRPIDKCRLLGLVKEEFGLDIEIIPDGDFYMDRSLNCEKFKNVTGFQAPSWEEMVRRMAEDPTRYDEWRKQKF
jgi:dTDP-4-dehydrorhamnose reductase